MKIQQIVRFMQDGHSVGLGTVILCDDGSLWHRTWDEMAGGPAWREIEVDVPARAAEPEGNARERVAAKQSRRRQVITSMARVGRPEPVTEDTY